MWSDFETLLRILRASLVAKFLFSWYTFSMNQPSPEGENKIESLENKVTKEAVINSLCENPKNIALLTTYIEARQKQIQAPYVSREDTERKTFEFTLELAEIYRDANLTEVAVDAYNEAADFAEANGMEKEYKAILGELAKLLEMIKTSYKV